MTTTRLMLYHHYPSLYNLQTLEFLYKTFYSLVISGNALIHENVNISIYNSSVWYSLC